MSRDSRFRARLAARRFWLAVVGTGVIMAGLVFQHYFKFVLVVGESMLPTLHSGDILLVDRRAYERGAPGRGDLVVARSGGQTIVKRIVGLPGEELEVREGVLYVNGQPCPEGYPVKPGLLEVGAGRLFEGDFATLGDNRAIPAELAIHPILSTSDMVGKVVFFRSRRRAGGDP